MDDSPIKLRSIDEPLPGTRSVMVCEPREETLMLFGSWAQATDMTCKCGALLVKGMFPDQFVAGAEELAKSSNPHQSFTVPASKSPYDIGPRPLWMAQVMVVSENGSLILRCPKCSEYSDVGWSRGAEAGRTAT